MCQLDLFGLKQPGTVKHCPDNHQRCLLHLPGSKDRYYCDTCKEILGELTLYWK